MDSNALTLNMLITIPTAPEFGFKQSVDLINNQWNRSISNGDDTIFKRDWSYTPMYLAEERDSINYYMTSTTTAGSIYDFYESVEFYPGYATVYVTANIDNYDTLFNGSLFLTKSNNGFYVQVVSFPSEPEDYDVTLKDMGCSVDKDGTCSVSELEGPLQFTVSEDLNNDRSCFRIEDVNQTISMDFCWTNNST